MKLASLRGEGRDGRLVVVSRDLTRSIEAGPAAPTLQAALDRWSQVAPRLQELADGLETGSLPSERFHEREALSPLPRAYLWADGSAYLNHVELVRKARGAEMPASFKTDPLMYQGGADVLLAPRAPIPKALVPYGLDFEAEVVVVVDDVPMGVSARDALSKIRLVMLVNDVSLRGLTGPELAKGFGFFQSKPASAFSPVAVTPDELGPAWKGGRLSLEMLTSLNGKPFGTPNAAEGMTFDFGALIAHAALTRDLCAGGIIGAGTISNKDADGSPGRPVVEGGRGYACIAEQRVVETLTGGAPRTPFLRDGDTIRIEMKSADGRSIFGAIEQTVA